MRPDRVIILCEGHALQWAKNHPFTDDCSPVSEWTGGQGQRVQCEVHKEQVSDDVIG